MSQQKELPTATIWTTESLPLIHPLTGKLQSTPTSLISSTTLYSWTMSYFSILAMTEKEAFDLAMTIPVVQHAHQMEIREAAQVRAMTFQMPTTTTTIGVTGNLHFMTMAHIPGPLWIATIKYKMLGPEHPLLTTPSNSSWTQGSHRSQTYDSVGDLTSRPGSANNYWQKTQNLGDPQHCSPRKRGSVDYNENSNYETSRTEMREYEKPQYVMIASGSPMYPQHQTRDQVSTPRPLNHMPVLLQGALDPDRKRWRPKTKTPAPGQEKPSLYPDLNSLNQTETHEQNVKSNGRLIPAPTIYIERVSHRLTKREMDQRLITFPETQTNPEQDVATNAAGAGQKKATDKKSTTEPSSVSKPNAETKENNTDSPCIDTGSVSTTDCQNTKT